MTNLDAATATLDYLARVISPATAVHGLVQVATDPERFVADHMPAIMQAADAHADCGPVLLWQSSEARALLRECFALCAREDMEGWRKARGIAVEPVLDTDIYDGYGGYAHNSDDGPQV